jgi:NADPH:quinone reductase-like Zn-dependent oxidoreductase
MWEKYGPPEGLRMAEVDKPAAEADEVLVKVLAVSVNPADWHSLRGKPIFARATLGVLRPKHPILGGDIAGQVEAVGGGVTRFKPGDEVYACLLDHGYGGFAEYVSVPADAMALKPPNLSFEVAAAVPIAAVTALQGLRHHGDIQPGQTVLINGASGGVGTFAVQIAKALGAEVHAVCSTRNIEQAQELGADRVFDYTREDFTRSGTRYDVLFDNAGNRSWSSMRRVLAPGGTVVLVGGPRQKRLLGPLGHIARIKLASKLHRQPAVFFIAKPNGDDLATLREMIEAGHVKPVIEQRYEFAQIGEAMQRMTEGHARAKIVVVV